MKKINKTGQSQTPSPLPLKGEGGRQQEGTQNQSQTPSPLPLKGEGGRQQEGKQYASHSTPSLTGRAGGGSAGGGSAEDGSLLWVPSWEGVLQWCPADLVADRPLRFWRVRKDKKGRMLRYQLATCLYDYSSPACSSHCLRKRRKIMLSFKGRMTNILCSVLTILCRDGFAIADRRHWVVDHINGNTLDDRPSNLQVISQKENLRKSVIFRKLSVCNNNIKTQVYHHLRQKLDEQRRRLVGTMPEASRMDVEIELSLWFNERKEKMYEEAIREVTGRER